MLINRRPSAAYTLHACQGQQAESGAEESLKPKASASARFPSQHQARARASHCANGEPTQKGPAPTSPPALPASCIGGRRNAKSCSDSSWRPQMACRQRIRDQEAGCTHQCTMPGLPPHSGKEPPHQSACLNGDRNAKTQLKGWHVRGAACRRGSAIRYALYMLLSGSGCLPVLNRHTAVKLSCPFETDSRPRLLVGALLSLPYSHCST